VKIRANSWAKTAHVKLLLRNGLPDKTFKKTTKLTDSNTKDTNMENRASILFNVRVGFVVFENFVVEFFVAASPLGYSACLMKRLTALKFVFAGVFELDLTQKIVIIYVR